MYSKSQANLKYNSYNRTKMSRKLLPYLYILPTMIFLAVFILKPFGFAILKSFYNYDAMTIDQFIGFDNYYKLFFQDDLFIISLKNLFVFFIGFLIAFAIPIIISELIFNIGSKKSQTVYRTLFVLPMVVPIVVTVLVWKFMYYPSIGVFSRIFTALNIPQMNFLGDVALVKPSIILIGFPWVSGLNLLVTFAALQSIDTSMMEAAKIDGASVWKRIISIDLPVIMPQIKTLFVLGIIGLIQDYEKIFILTKGGPNNESLVPGLHMYLTAFGTGADASLFGYSCSMAVVLFIVTLLISIITLKRKNKD